MNTFDCLNTYYSSYDEEGRLASRHGQTEYLTTMHYLEAYLAPGMRLCEIGAGTGRYSVSLAAMGYDVTAVELIPHNLDILRAKVTDGMRLRSFQGNALDLSFLPDGAFDITLLLGPMYHLYSARDKLRALSEALRVTKTGGVLMVSYCISDATVIQYLFKQGMLADTLRREMLDPRTFDLRSAPADLFELVKKSDIDELDAYLPAVREHYVASDGAANFMRETVDAMDDETFSHFMRYHLSVCEREDLCGATHHVLDILRKTEDRAVDIPAVIDTPHEIGNEIRAFCLLPVTFEGFCDALPPLTDGELSLRLRECLPAAPEKGYVPAYMFDICMGDTVIGRIDLRIGYNEKLYYGGNIGYAVEPAFRGHGYAGRAVKLLLPVARHHGMTELRISNSAVNTASRRVCEKLGARFLRCVTLPEDNDMRALGHVKENLFALSV